MRISDWSSDVCSSDLPAGQRCGPSCPYAGLRNGKATTPHNLTRGWQGQPRIASGAQRHLGIGIGGPCLHDRHLAQVDLVEGPLFAVPAFAALGHLEAEAHAAKVAASSEGFHVPARLSVGTVEREGPAPAKIGRASGRERVWKYG